MSYREIRDLHIEDGAQRLSSVETHVTHIKQEEEVELVTTSLLNQEGDTGFVRYSGEEKTISYQGYDGITISGDEAFIHDTQKALQLVSDTKVGQVLLKTLNERDINIRFPPIKDVIRIEDGITFYKK